MAGYTKREERHAEQRAISGERIREQPPRKQWKASIGAPPTLGRELRSADKWVWFWCPACQHHGPLAFAQLAIRFGMNITTVEAQRE